MAATLNKASVLLTLVRMGLLAAAATAVAGCDGIYFRRIELTAPDAASLAISSQSAQEAIRTLREYAAQIHLKCPEANQLPFECARQPVQVQSSHGHLSVCYSAMGTAFERHKFERRFEQLEVMLVSHFGADSVRGIPEMCRSRT